MKTTKETRFKMRRARYFLESPAAEEMEKLLDDLDTQEKRIEILEAALESISKECCGMEFTADEALAASRKLGE